MSKKPVRIPANAGRIVIEINDLPAINFWIRVFGLEPYIEAAQAQILQHIPAKWGAVPVINEYHCGHLHWSYVLLIDVDAIGVTGGMGLIFFGDDQNAKAASQHRDRLAAQIVQALNKGLKSGQFGVEMELDLAREPDIEK